MHETFVTKLHLLQMILMNHAAFNLNQTSQTIDIFLSQIFIYNNITLQYFDQKTLNKSYESSANKELFSTMIL